MTAKSIAMPRTILLISLIFPPFVAGQKGPRNYFPLKQGAVYNFEVDGNEETLWWNVTQSLEWHILPSRKLNGATVFPRKHVTNTGDSLLTFFGADGSGVYVAAFQNRGMGQPKVWASPQYVLKSPLQEGAQWTGEMYLPGATRSLSYTSVVESTNEIVTVPAGTFRDCVKIKTTSSNEDSTVEDLLFYAPGVGLVKFSRQEVSATGTNSGVAAQLTFFRPD